jgi:hypothetical protein
VEEEDSRFQLPTNHQQWLVHVLSSVGHNPEKGITDQQPFEEVLVGVSVDAQDIHPRYDQRVW